MCSQVQYNLLTPPCSEPGSVQDGGKRSGLPLHYGFKEVEENWAKHCSSGKKGHESSGHVIVTSGSQHGSPARICIETKLLSHEFDS